MPDSERPMRLLIVDVQPGPASIGRQLATQLAALGFAAELCANGTAALAECAGAGLLLIAGDKGAVELARDWNARTNAPVLALTGDAAARDALASLGARVLIQPVRLAELSEAVRECLRAPPAPVALGEVRFDPASRDLVADSGAVRLTEKEAAILAYLHRAAGATVPRDELLARVWGFADAQATHTLETHIYRLRKKLEEAGAPALVSEAGGYRLASPESSSAR